jgi:hypothetical protein
MTPDLLAWSLMIRHQNRPRVANRPLTAKHAEERSRALGNAADCGSGGANRFAYVVGDRPISRKLTKPLKREEGNRQAPRGADYAVIVARELHGLPMSTEKLDGSQVEGIEGSHTDRPWV